MRGIAAKHLFNTNTLMRARNNDTLSLATERRPIKLYNNMFEHIRAVYGSFSGTHEGIPSAS